MVDWSQLRSLPDPATGVIAGFRAGQDQAQHTAQIRALGNYDPNDPGATATALVRAGDPTTAIAIRQANSAEKGNVLTGQEHDQEALRRGHEAIANILGAIRNKTPDLEERRRMGVHTAQFLASEMPPAAAQQILQEAQNFDYSDANIDAHRAQYVDQLTQQRMDIAGREQTLREKDTWNDNSREDARFAEARRAGRVSEGYEGERIGIARQGMGYEGDRLSLARDQEARQRAADLARMDREANDPSTIFGSILARVSRGETLTTGEQRAYDMYLNAHRSPDPYASPGGASGGADEYGTPTTPAAPPASVASLGAPRPAPSHTPPTVRAIPDGSPGAPVRRERRVGAVRPDRPVTGAVATPQTAADFAAVPIGGRYRDPGDGQVYIRRR